MIVENFNLWKRERESQNGGYDDSEQARNQWCGLV